MTKGIAAMLVYTTKECHSKSIVIVHQHGGYDVTCKPRIVASPLSDLPKKKSSSLMMLLSYINV